MSIGTSDKLRIENAQPSDLGAITDIYNDAILNSTATFDTAPKTAESQSVWFDSHGDRHPILVAKQGHQVVAWASLSEWSGRCAYADTAEISTYVARDFWGNGIGKEITLALVAVSKQKGLHTLIARITSGNVASIRLYRSIGFVEVGVMKEVGRKFGSLLDVHLLQLML